MKYKLMFGFLICLSLSCQSINAADTFDWSIKIDTEPITSLSTNADGTNIRHPNYNGGTDDREVNVDGDPIDIAYLYIERDVDTTSFSSSIECERVIIGLVITEDNVDEIVTIIEPYTNAVPPEDLSVRGDFYFITEHIKTHGSRDSGENVQVKEEHYHEGDSSEGIFLGLNHVYKVTVTYKISGVSYYRVFWLVEDMDLPANTRERWDIIYNADYTPSTTFEEAGYGVTQRNVNNLSERVGLPPDDDSKNLSLDTVFGVVFYVFIGMFLIQIGFSLYIKFQSIGSEMGAMVIILTGIAFLGSAITLATGVVGSVLDALGIFTKPAGWIWGGLKSIGSWFGIG